MNLKTCITNYFVGFVILFASAILGGLAILSRLLQRVDRRKRRLRRGLFING